MERNYIEDQTFNKVDFSQSMQQGEYENCVFNQCNFSNMDLSNMGFAECCFNGCNLSMAKTIKTAFKEVQFKDCKIVGVHFDQCSDSLFAVAFDHCVVNFSSFYKLKLKKTVFKNSSLHEVDFTDAELTLAIFDNCDLQRAIFEQTVLEKADFRTAYNYTFDPERNKLKKARFSAAGIGGLLAKYDINIS